MGKVIHLEWVYVPKVRIDDAATKLACFNLVATRCWGDACQILWSGGADISGFAISKQEDKNKFKHAAITLSLWSRCREVKWVVSGPFCSEGIQSAQLAYEALFYAMYVSGCRAIPYTLNGERAKELICVAQDKINMSKVADQLRISAKLNDPTEICEVWRKLLETALVSSLEDVRLLKLKEEKLTTATNHLLSHFQIINGIKNYMDSRGMTNFDEFTTQLVSFISVAGAQLDKVGENVERMLQDKDAEIQRLTYILEGMQLGGKIDLTK